MPSPDSPSTTEPTTTKTPAATPAISFDASASLRYFRSLPASPPVDEGTEEIQPVSPRTPSVSITALLPPNSTVFRVQTGFDPREHLTRYSSPYSHSPAGASYLASSSSPSSSPHGVGNVSGRGTGVGGDVDIVDGFLTLFEKDLVIKLRSLSLLEVPDVFPTKDCPSFPSSPSGARPIPAIGSDCVDADGLVDQVGDCGSYFLGRKLLSGEEGIVNVAHVKAVDAEEAQIALKEAALADDPSEDNHSAKAVLTESYIHCALAGSTRKSLDVLQHFTSPDTHVSPDIDSSAISKLKISSDTKVSSGPKTDSAKMDPSPARPPVPPRTGRAPLLQQYQQQQPKPQGRTLQQPVPAPSTGASSHILNQAFFRSPQFCLHCSDYIWGSGGHRGVHCSRCRQSFHAECAPFVKSSPCFPSPSSAPLPQVFAEDLSVDKWSVDTTLQWLAATNLFLYADQFRANLGNLLSLRCLDNEALLRWRINNENHRLAILLAVKQLYPGQDDAIGGLQNLWTSPGPHTGRDISYAADSHRLSTITLGGKPRPCFKCGVVLWGLVRQALSCLDCGRFFHRTCAATGLPECCTGLTPQQPNQQGQGSDGSVGPSMLMLPGNGCSNHGAGFGLALSAIPGQFLTSAVTQRRAAAHPNQIPQNVPLVVFLCVSELERRARSGVTGGTIDLFKIYDNPAFDKAEDIVACFKRCHNLLSFQQMSERLQSFDAQAVAGCLQRFLLDLPSPVFPEKLFPRLLQIFAAFSGSVGAGGAASAATKMTSTTIKALRSLFSSGEPTKDDLLISSNAIATAAATATSTTATTSTTMTSVNTPLVDEWHPVHRGTFDFLMAHLSRVWSIQASLFPNSHRTDEPPTQLLPTQLASGFSVLLIGPPWHDVCQLGKLKSTLTLIVETLLFEFDWGENVRDLVALVRSAKPPAPPSRPAASGAISIVGHQQQPQHKSSNPASSSPSKLPSLSSTPPPSFQQQQQQQQQPLQRSFDNPSPIPHQGTPVAGCSCYWGSISRDDANSLLKGTPDGTFLLRDSFRDPQIPYALHVQFHGQSRPIQVLVSPEGMYGFADRNLCHKSVFLLIDYHKNNSLEEFNRELKDLKLVKPLVKKTRPPSTVPHRAAGVSGAVPSVSEAAADNSVAGDIENPDPKIVQQLIDNHAEWLVKQFEHDEKFEEHAEVTERLRENNKALEAFRETVSQYESHADLHRRMANEVETAADRATMASNYKILLRSLEEVKSEKAKLEKRNEEDAKLIRQLANHTNQLKPEIGNLMSKKQDLIRQLTQASYSSCYNNDMIENIFREAFRSLWYSEDCKREDANGFLQGKRDGTFLIRKAAGPPVKFSLSIVHGGRVMHARIECFKQPLEYPGVEGYVYCFDNRYMFPSLDLMVQHYFRKSLKDHNPQLDTFLKYPVGYYLNSASVIGDEDGDAKDADFDSFSSK